MSWPKVTLVECPRGGHNMVVEDGFCEHCAEADAEACTCWWGAYAKIGGGTGFDIARFDPACPVHGETSS